MRQLIWQEDNSFGHKEILFTKGNNQWNVFQLSSAHKQLTEIEIQRQNSQCMNLDTCLIFQNTIYIIYWVSKNIRTIYYTLDMHYPGI